MWRSGEQCGVVVNRDEQCGVVVSSGEQCGVVQPLRKISP